jgi:hypothetical protein
MEVNFELQASTNLPPGKEPFVLTEIRAWRLAGKNVLNLSGIEPMFSSVFHPLA